MYGTAVKPTYMIVVNTVSVNDGRGESAQTRMCCADE